MRPLTALAIAVSVTLLAPALALVVSLGPWLLPGPSIDGFPLGPLVDCTAEGSRCDELVTVARTALGAREPGHAEIADASVFIDDPTINRTVLLRVVVFALADGTRHAAGVLCNVGGCIGLARYPG
jgi:hypothetical protein